MEKFNLKYRKDIDGLRAIAVLSVVGFHAFPNWVKGGYVGVDIFFVISGYLISIIIFQSLSNETFSFYDFYSRRIKRIFPALILLLCSCFVLGFFEDPLDKPLNLLGKYIIGGVGFFTNFVLWNESSYFDKIAETKPLLHLWSLSIEEQFYIFWPISVVFIWKRKYNLFLIIFLILVFSFAINVYTVGKNPIAAFYSPLSRIWELMIGSMLAYITLYRPSNLEPLQNLISFFGLTSISIGVLFLDKQKAFPGWYALLPTVGAFFVIFAGHKAWFNRTLLSNPLLVGIGLISYPLYLWHWLGLYILSNFNHNLHVSSQKLRLIIITLSILLSWVTYKFLEYPIRFGKNSKRIVWLLCLIMIGIGILGSIAFYSGFDRFRFSKDQNILIRRLQRVTELKNLEDMYGKKPCFLYDLKYTFQMFLDNDCFKINYPNKPIVFLFGDSHSASLSLGLRPLIEGKKINFAQISSGWCAPTSNIKENLLCVNVNNLAHKKISELKPDLVILHAYWVAAHFKYFVGPGKYEDHFIKEINEIIRLGAKQVIVVGEIPTWKVNLPNNILNNFVLKNLPIPNRTYLGIDEDSLKMDSTMKQIKFPKGSIYYSLRDSLCNDNGCMVMVGPNLESDMIVWDYGHLTNSGSNFVNNIFLKPVLFDLLNIR